MDPKKRQLHVRTTLFAFVVLAALIPGSPAAAATFTVTVFADDNTANGNCTLREAIRAANENTAVDACPAGTAGADTITLVKGTYTLAVGGTEEEATATGDLDITESLNVNGPGADLTAIDAGGIDRVFDIRTGGLAVLISGVTLRGGNVPAGAMVDEGGAIANRGTLTLDGVHVTGNRSEDHGGGLWNDEAVFHISNSAFTGNVTVGGDSGAIDQIDGASPGVSTITNTTLSGNSSTLNGGALAVEEGNPVELNNVTITGNSADQGGGIYNGGLMNDSFVTVRNTIVTANSATTAGPDCFDELASEGHNIVGNNSDCAISPATGDQIGTPATPIDPKLGPLADNGGPTPTHALLDGSPAINAGDPATPARGGSTACAARDQRGAPRERCDIGAYERVLCNRILVNVVGTNAKDKLRGGAGSQGMLGLGGKDALNGKGGKDALCGGAGKDKLKGGGGKDILDGDVGKDTCIGGGGRDRARFCENEKKVP